MKILNIKTYPFYNQIAGTSGLRQKTKIFLQKNYLHNYIQAICNIIQINNKTLVIGGDGRFFNQAAIQIVTAIAIANGVKKIYIAHHGYLSTPATSIFIRKYQIDCGIVLSASHNPAGLDGDFGVKINNSQGAPLDIATAKQISAESKQISHYLMVEDLSLDIDVLQSFKILDVEIEIFDGVSDYVLKMQEIFDFPAINHLINDKGLSFYFNALSGITGPYAYEIFHHYFHLPLANLFNIQPKEDFGGLIADPNPTTITDFIQQVKDNKAIQLGFACDADGDRNMIFSAKHCLEPSDSIALILAYGHLVDYYKPIVGVARSKPTSHALDLVASALNIPCYVVPTGWKFFTNLFSHHKITFCGEESFGTGSKHSREKDGLWAILFWLHILAKSGKNFDDILENHWQKYGRVFFSRYDVKDISSELANQVIQELKENATMKIGKALIGNYFIESCQLFDYLDDISGETIYNQGLVIKFNQGAEVMARLSGTGTQGSTIRFYFSQQSPQEQWNQDKFVVLKQLIANTFALIKLKIKPDFRV